MSKPEQVKQILLLKLLELNGDRCSKLSTEEKGGWVLFSDEQKCWALFFSWASLGEHHSSEEQDEKSTFFRWAPEMSTVFFRRATQLSTFSQMRKVGEHLLSSWASRMLSKVDEHNFSSKPSRFYIWKYLNTVATDAQSWAQMSKRVVHFFFSWAKKVWSYFHQMSRTR